jgi:2-amino-4-hydroxy-6-hydroxymethyldihydropteridine diphosphokinase
MSGAEPAVAYLGLGSNVGDRAGALQRALDHLSRLPSTAVLRRSPIYETEPWGYRDQDPFLNAVAELRTGLSVVELFHACKRIEAAMGRAPSARYHPRVIDIDVLLYDAMIHRDPLLVVPHPELAARRFVLQPLCDLAPSLVHPVLRLPLADLLALCPDTGAIAPFFGPA